MAEEQTTPVVQDPSQPDPTTAAPAAPVPAAPAAPSPVGDGPWAQDLATLFPDEATRGQVDQFLRSKVQPYTTQLEQKSSQAENAVNLWNQFEQSPVDTYVQVTRELYGDDAANAVLATLQQQLDANPEAQAQGQLPQQQAVNDPRIEAMYEHFTQTQAEQSYDEELTRIKAEHADVADDEPLFHMCVNAAEGDFNKAYELFAAEVARAAQRYQPQTTPAQEDAPAVLASDTATTQSSATPVEPKKQTIGEAIEDFMSDQRMNREAPPVA